MKKILGTILLAVAFALAVPVHADDVQGPDDLIRSTAQQVLAIVKSDRELVSGGNQQKLLALVEEKILPHFDFVRMTRLTAGRYWRTATPEQQTALVNEFRTLLVRTYTTAFSRFSDQTVQVMPVRMQPDDDEATVKTMIVKTGETPIEVDYELKKTGTEWKVFDLTVEGASLIATYRSTFADQIQQSGFDGLIKSLADKNKANAGVPLHKADSK